MNGLELTLQCCNKLKESQAVLHKAETLLADRFNDEARGCEHYMGNTFARCNHANNDSFCSIDKCPYSSTEGDARLDLKSRINNYRGIEDDAAAYAHKYQIFELIDKLLP